jgi:hypothetical protein
MAAFLLPASVAGLCVMAANCTPRDDLSAFAAGTRPTPALPREPAGQGPVALPAPGAPAIGEEQGAPAETAETTSSDAPARATDLAGADDPSGGELPPASAAPPPSDRGDSPDDGEQGGTLPEEGAPAAEAPGISPTPPSLVPTPAPQQFRFARLVADSDFAAGPLTSIAEFDVLGADAQPLDRDGWLATADSAEPTFVGGAPAALAIDGQTASMWHTPWFQVLPPPHPHFLQVDMGRAQTVSGFRYLSRQDGALDGRVAAYRFFVSADGVDWGEPVVAGTLVNTDQPQDVSIR